MDKQLTRKIDNRIAEAEKAIRKLRAAREELNPTPSKNGTSKGNGRRKLATKNAKK